MKTRNVALTAAMALQLSIALAALCSLQIPLNRGHYGRATAMAAWLFSVGRDKVR